MEPDPARIPQNTTILQMIEGHAALHPQALAVRDQHQGLSYEELNQLANQWAHRLRKLGVRLSRGWLSAWSAA